MLLSELWWGASLSGNDVLLNSCDVLEATLVVAEGLFFSCGMGLSEVVMGGSSVNVVWGLLRCGILVSSSLVGVYR